MISEVDIAKAMQLRLSQTSGISSIVWENQDSDLRPPYVIAQMVPVARVDNSLNGEITKSTGYLMASVVIGPDQFATPALTLAQAILAKFPPTTEIAVSTGTVVIGDSGILPGYNDGIYWRVPVRVNYFAF